MTPCSWLTKAVEHSIALESRSHEARARRDLATALRARGAAGDAERAEQHAAMAADVASEIGLVLIDIP